MTRYLAVAAVILIATILSEARAAEPYDFRGARLGMTLEEFKLMSFPDPNSRVLGAEYAAEAKLICTGDHEYIAMVSKDEAAVGAVRCLWMLPPNRAHFRTGWQPAYIEVTDFSTEHIDYRFAPSAAGEKVLRQIAVTITTKAFPVIVAGLKDKFGEPVETLQGQVQNGIGNMFDNMTVRWDNGVSTLSVVERSGEIDQMSMLYTHTSVDAVYQKAIAARKGPPKL